MKRRSCLAFLVAVGILAAGALHAGTDESTAPVSCFVVHCEPTNAAEGMFHALTELVSLADECAIPLTIDFTAQWAEMILADEEKLAAVAAWIEAGHEVGGHHHAYWATLERGATWDGYTNTPASDIRPEDRPRLRGTMDDYMGLLLALPGERTSACMGLDDALDQIDWPEGLSYGTSGHALEHCVSRPARMDCGGTDVWVISHGLILQLPGALANLYAATDEKAVFAVVGHVYNFAEDRRSFESWFRFLNGRDPTGVRRRTVTGAIEEWMASDG